MDNSILQETIERVGGILGPELDRITVERAVVGVFFTGVKLGNGMAGACATPLETVRETFCCASAVAGGRSPGNLRGCSAFALAQEALGSNGLGRGLGIAALNALSDTCWRHRPHPHAELCVGVDAFEATGIRPADKVVLVGAFVPFLRALKQRSQPFIVLEQNRATLKSDEMPFLRPAEEARTVIPEADVVLITGSALVNDTLEDLLALKNPGARATVVGPTVGLLPDAFLRHGADILGSVRITEPDAFLDVLAEGGGGPDFLGRSVQKVVLVRRSATGAEAA